MQQRLQESLFPVFVALWRAAAEFAGMLWAGRLVFICQAQAPGLHGLGMPARSQDSLMMATALLHAAVPLKRVVQPEIPAAGPEYGHLGKNYVCGLSMDVLVCECDVSCGDMSSASHTAGQILLLSSPGGQDCLASHLRISSHD